MPKTKPGISAAAKTLLKLVPPDGEFIGNTNLIRRTKLGDKYWGVRDELIDAGFLIRGKGRGGSVARFAADVQEPRAALKNDRLSPDPTELNALLTAFFKISTREKEYKLAVKK